jgi:hypothetical protein
MRDPYVRIKSTAIITSVPVEYIIGTSDVGGIDLILGHRTFKDRTLRPALPQEYCPLSAKN